MNNNKVPPKEFLIFLSVLADAVLIMAADLAAFLIRFGVETGPFPRFNFQPYLQLLLPIIVLRLICFYIYGLYDKPKYKTSYDIVLNVFKATTASTLIIIVVAFLLRVFAYPRTVIFFSWLITIPLIIFWRLLLKRLINWTLGKDYFTSFALVVGTDRGAQRLATRLVREAHIHRKLVGFISVDTHPHPAAQGVSVLGEIKDLPGIIENYVIDEVVIAAGQISEEKIIEIFKHFSGSDVIFRIVPNLYEATIGTMASSPIEKVPLISPASAQKITWYKDFKRLMDTGGAMLGLILFSPLMLLIAIAVKLSSSGPVIYRQTRVGLNGKIFTLFKFRTMIEGSEENGPEFARENDQRVTSAGRWLRRFCLDELPQLFNVLVSDMSLVGPRPERPGFNQEFIKKIPFYAERLQVKPGITGWAQVTHGYASSLQDHQEKLLFDVFYLENMSFALDVLIILKTLGAVAKGERGPRNSRMANGAGEKNAFTPWRRGQASNLEKPGERPG